MDKRTVVVTGGTRGIGLGIAQALVDAGYYVIVIARNWNAALSDTISSEHFVAWDLSKTETLFELAQTVRKNYGKIYGLVNNAGIGTSGILSTMPDSQIAHIINMNVTAPITLTKYMVRSMMTAGEGRVVNIASIVANTGYSGLSAYSASKAAMLGFTRSFAREVGPLGITVNAVAPGFIATEMTHGLTDKHRHQIAKRSALQRMATVDDIANMVTFLISDKAANITGTVMTVDAGNTA